MESYDELLKRLPQIAEAVNKFDSDLVQQRAFELLLERLGVEITPPKSSPAPGPAPRSARPPGSGKAPGKRAPKSGVSLLKQLNLRPKNQQSLQEFVEEKKPKNNHERNLAAVYYVAKVAQDPVSISHVYTCYKDRKWHVPSNLENSLQVTASRHGWIDTSDSEDIKITTQGENHIELDMAPEPEET
jgi:hypothetical protein